MGRKKSDEVQYTVDWGKIADAVEVAGFTRVMISQILGKNNNWLNDCKSKKYKITEKDLTTISFITKSNIEDFILKPIEDESPNSIEGDNVDVISLINELDKKINKIIELLAGLSKTQPTPVNGYDSEPTTRHERAVKILRTLLDGEKGRTKKTEFIKQLMVQNIGSSYAEAAIKELGASVAVVGYGNNKTTWIMKGEE